MPARQSYVADRKVIKATRKALLVALGRLFHSHRAASNLSQRDLGAEVGLGQGSVSAVENGATNHPEHVDLMAARLGVEATFVDMYKALL